MLVNQRKNNLYLFITVTFTLVHLNRTKHQQQILLPKAQKIKFR